MYELLDTIWKEPSIVIHEFCGTYPYNPDVYVRFMKSRSVYALYTSQVVYIHKYTADRWCVAFLIDGTQGYLFKNIFNIESNLKVGDRVSAGQMIGSYKQSSKDTLIISYFNSQPSTWPVRLFDMQFYKHDPSTLLVEDTTVMNLTYASTLQSQNLSVDVVPHEQQTVFAEDSDYNPGEPVPKLQGE